MKQDECTQQELRAQELPRRLLLSRNFLKDDISTHIDGL